MSSITRRKSSLAALKRIQSQQEQTVSSEGENETEAKPVIERKDDGGYDASADHSADSDDAAQKAARVHKKRKTTSTASRQDKKTPSPFTSSFFDVGPHDTLDHRACKPPKRQHATSYHRPLFLDPLNGRDARDRLLAWFDMISTSRGMPWRKAWLDPKAFSDPSELRSQLERRAYEVWISEIMLQQTRVVVVIDYYNRWISKWPTIHDLAAASVDEVLAMWTGLGYYSRAKSIHAAAKKIVEDDKTRGLLPERADELEASMPGVGRYTGGAISAIVFGHAAPMVDGNVLRVLSRQLGILASVKTNKMVIDALWSAATALVEQVAQDFPTDGSEEKQARSDRPGRWGQALMELGSTVCTPKPKCAECPVQSTCRAFGEGKLLTDNVTAQSSKKRTEVQIVDVEDLCMVCQPYEDVIGPDEDLDAKAPPVKKVATKAKQATLASFAFTTKNKQVDTESTTASNQTSKNDVLGEKAMDIIATHAMRFPVKTVKKSVREEETLVCAIQRFDGRFLVHKRPEKGLLAGLWELPSDSLVDVEQHTAAKRKQKALQYTKDLLLAQNQADDLSLKQIGEVGNVPWLFSHLKLTMYVQVFRLGKEVNESKDLQDRSDSTDNRRWLTCEEMEQASMGTGMRKCWTLAKDSLSL